MSHDFASQFPHYYPINGTFVVRNIITNSNKTIRIFDYPIPVGTTRDLLRIPGVSEDSIRASLLKGAIRNKILAGEIEIVGSDVNLLQFNDTQKTFLENAGVEEGLEVTGGTGDLSEHDTLRQLIHFVDEGPGDGFASGAFKEIIGQPFPTSITWYTATDKTQKIVEKLITRDGSQNPVTIVWNMYDTDGTSIVHTVTDTIAFVNNSFESTRTRAIS
jgi:hypothetical protein